MTTVADTLNVYDNAESRTPIVIVSSETVADDMCPTLLAEAERTKNVPCVCYAEKSFSGYKEDDVSPILRHSGGSVGGGSEMFIVQILSDA